MDNKPIEGGARIEKAAEEEKAAELLGKIAETDLEVYKVLSPKNPDAAREVFLADDSMEVPPFEYDIDEEEINQHLITLGEVYREAESAGFDREDELQVGILADDSAKKNAFVRDCLDYRAAKTPEEKQAAAEAHRFSGGELYGRPEEKIFCSLLRTELAKIDPEKLSPEDRKMYDSLVEEIGDLGEEEVESFRPSPETVAKFSEMINMLYGNLFSHIPEDQEEFTPEEACAIVNEIIREEIGEDATEYHAVMSDKTGTCSVSHKKREIIFPVKRASGNFSRTGLKQIIVHEFGTHVYRGMVYEEDELAALSREMPGNEEIDEGIAKCCEQAVVGEYKESGIEHYINIGLATFKGKNFRQVFEIQRKLKYLKGCMTAGEETPEEKEARFHSEDERLFNLTTRCFRGTGELPNNKDLVYYNGAKKVWKYIEEHIDDPDLLDQLFLAGKTDITSKEQERLVYEKKTKIPANISEKTD